MSGLPGSYSYSLAPYNGGAGTAQAADNGYGGLSTNQFYSTLKGARDKLNIDDIEGAAPKRFVGVSYVLFINNSTLGQG